MRSTIFACSAGGRASTGRSATTASASTRRALLMTITSESRTDILEVQSLAMDLDGNLAGEGLDPVLDEVALALDGELFRDLGLNLDQLLLVRQDLLLDQEDV